MKRQGFLKGIGIRLAALFLTALSLFMLLLPKPKAEIAFADSLSLSLDSTSVMDDLGSTIDLSKYPAVKGAEPKVYSFMEYCYSPNAFRRADYALYIYVYNPSQTEYSEFTGVSSVNMAFKYRTDESGAFVLNEKNKLTAVDYRSFPLKNCGYTQGGSVDKLFYKFRVMGVEDILNNVVKMDEAGMERRYDFVGLQLFTKGADLAEDYEVGQEIYYKGYSKGYGNSLESTLSSRWEKGEYVKLNVEHTFYRTKTSSLGNGHQNQLDTVYFQVPDRLFKSYGTLQRIKAEWWEYKTKEIAVTDNSSFYNEAIEHIGEKFDYNQVDCGEYGLVDNYRFVDNNPLPGMHIDGYYAADWKWRFYGPITTEEGFCETLYYLFHTKYGYGISSYDPYADIEEIGGITSDRLTRYIKEYDETFENGTLPIKEGKISADLFEDDIDEDRKMDNERGKIQKGYSYYDFDASLDLQEWESWSDQDAGFWEEVEGGYWEGVGDTQLLFLNLYYLLKNNSSNIPEEDGRSLSPIYEVDEKDLQGSPAEISERLCVNISDVERIKKAYDEAVKVDGKDDEEKRLILFRFATSDYYSKEVDIVSLGTGTLGGDEFIENQAYIAQQSVFLDFDVIQLTFNKDGVYTVIPVVADPIDIINDLTPPVDESVGGCNGCANFDFGRIFAGIIVFLVVVILIKWYTKIRDWWREEQIYKNTKNNKGGKRKR